MLTFVVDDLSKGFTNLFPLIRNNQNLTEACWLPKWLDFYDIKYSTTTIENATPNSWYPVGINYWDFAQDYLQVLSSEVLEKLSNESLRLLFFYREGDSPARIRDHIEMLANTHGINKNLIWLISGNSNADSVKNCRFFWYFDCNYFFQTRQSKQLDINLLPRDKNITCLCRTHKSWREWFVYNLYISTPIDKNYYSYGNVDDLISDDFKLWDDDSIKWFVTCVTPLLAPRWHISLPVQADDLNLDQHNQHDIVIGQHFQNSYWNVVLETLLDTEDSGGIFVTEKSLKPLRNGQSFLILGCYHTLEFLRDKGYQTFSGVIDESYDEIPSVHNRWYHVFEIAQWLANLDRERLQKMQERCLPIIRYNQEHFQRSRRDDLISLTTYLDAI